MIFVVWFVMILLFLAAFIAIHWAQGGDTNLELLLLMALAGAVPGVNLLALIVVLVEWTSKSGWLDGVIIKGRNK